MIVRRYLPCDLISAVWFYCDRRKTKKQANVQAKLLNGQGKPKETFCRSQWRITKKLVHDNSVPRNTKKKLKICKNELHSFALRNYWEGYRINQTSFRIERLSSKFHSCPRSVRFTANCSFFGISFSLGHYPPIYQPPKEVYLLNIFNNYSSSPNGLWAVNSPWGRRSSLVVFYYLRSDQINWHQSQDSSQDWS